MSELPDVITFEVLGKPATQGSKQSQAIYRRGPDGPLPVMKQGRVLTTTRDADPNLMAWRQGVAAAARAAYQGPLLTGPLRLEVTFWRPRPKGHFGSGRNAGKLKPTAPAYPTPRPDLTKLTRAVEDSLQGVVLREDAQIVRQVIAKDWGECFLTQVRLTLLDGTAESERGTDA